MNAEPCGLRASPDLMVRALSRNHHLEGGKTYRIGRDPASEITVNDPRVSWAHAVLKVEGANWVLQDLDSSNGTFLGPDRTQRVEINRPCEVRLGHQDNGPVVRFQPQFPTTWAAAAPTPSSEGRRRCFGNPRNGERRGPAHFHDAPRIATGQDPEDRPLP